MWKSEDFEHQLIQTTVVEAGVDNEESEKPILLAYSTSYVSENYVRIFEQAQFNCELFLRQDPPGYEVCHTTTISTRGKVLGPGELIWAQRYTYFLGVNFSPTLSDHIPNEMARETINAYARHLFSVVNH